MAPVNTDDVARLRSALGRTSRWLDRSSRGGELSRSQMSILGTVVRRGPLGIGELAEIEGVNPTMLSRVVAKLDDQGLVERRVHPQDRRAATVQVTDAGYELFLRIRAERTRLLAVSLEALPAEQRDTLMASAAALESLLGIVEGRTR